MDKDKKAARNVEVIKLYCENNTLAFVGEKFGLSHQAIRLILIKNGIKPRPMTVRPQPFKRPRRRSLKDRFLARVDKKGDNECWLWNGKTNPSGYGRLRRNGEVEYSHRLAFIFAYGKIPEDKGVLHECGNASCCNPKHLYAGTQKQNALDMIRHGTVRRGETNHLSKFTDEQVLEIRRIAKTKTKSLRQIANDFGVSPTAIHCIVNRKTWAHL